MSGQPYKYYTDVEKYRNEYLDTLNLQTNINDMNLQANKTYKETGALPAVSQMKDSRTTSEILADTEKLKIDIISSLSTVSNHQFASAVVQRIMNSPLNQDNSLLTFTAQRMNDLVDKLKRIYTYGIKGDQNDIQQIVNFIISMYNDKNAIASSTKDFLTKYGTNNLGQFTGPSRGGAMDNIKAVLAELNTKLNVIYGNLEGLKRTRGLAQMIIDSLDDTTGYIRTLSQLILKIIELIPNNERLAYIDNALNQLITNNVNINNVANLHDKVLVDYKEFINTSIPAVGNISLTQNKLSKYYEIVMKSVPGAVNTGAESMHVALENINKLDISLLNLREILTPSELFGSAEITELLNGFNLLHNGNFGNNQTMATIRQATTQAINEFRLFYNNPATKPFATAGISVVSLITSMIILNMAINLGYKISDVYANILNFIKRTANEEYHKEVQTLNETEIQQLNAELEHGAIIQELPQDIRNQINISQVMEALQSINLNDLQPGELKPIPKPGKKDQYETIARPEDVEQIEKISKDLNLPKIGSVYNNDVLGGQWKLISITKDKKGKAQYNLESLDPENPSSVSVSLPEFKSSFLSVNQTIDNSYIPPFQNIEDLGYYDTYTPPELSYNDSYYNIGTNPYDIGYNASNIGGHGIRKRGRPKGSGIQRKYADVVKRSIIDGKGIQEDMRFIKFGKYLINNKKLNDGILAVKRPSGNNILEFPSQRISKNMQSVIKTMVGGGMPKYEQFECLSEPEKAYLHKLSSKANILDKFSIPAPSKSQYEKDIHDFEVMKGEIMSGNDNKDLIKKFKLHIMKLSKMGSLPKHDVSDILETLIQLGY